MPSGGGQAASSFSRQRWTGGSPDCHCSCAHVSRSLLADSEYCPPSRTRGVSPATRGLLHAPSKRVPHGSAIRCP
eukprot:3552522-Pyramimonas_sp.AAC.1